MYRTLRSTLTILTFCLAFGCEGSGGPVDEKADTAGEMAEELQQERLRMQGYGPLDRQIAGELAEERYELIVETRESSAKP